MFQQPLMKATEGLMKTTRSMGKALSGGIGLLLVCTLWGQAAAQTCVPSPPGLVSWWPGDGDVQDIEDDNYGTLQNGATFASGMVGQAFSLDGIDDYIRVPNHPSLHPASGLTIEAWIHSASTDGPHTIVGKWNDQTGEWSYNFKDWDFSDTLSIELSESIHTDLASLQGSISIPLGTWVHVATTYDATEGVVRLYFNGIEDASLEVGPGRLIDTSLTDLLIGALGGGEVIEQLFAGLIDEVSIYNRALTAEEIAAIYTAGSAGKCKPVTFADLAAHVDLSIGPDANDDTFMISHATFILGDGSDGIAPLADAVTLQIGTFSLTIPPNSFQPTAAGAFAFVGVIDGVTLQVTITPLTRATFAFEASGAGVTLSGIVVPVPVELTIGDDGGSTTLPVAELSADSLPPQR